MDVEKAFKEKLSKVPTTVKGKIYRLLPDDHEDTHHQRFVVRIHDDHTVLIAHNLERAYRAPVRIGDEVEIKGTYVWNKLGGILHNTHHDDRKACRKTNNGHIVCGPAHEDGWIILAGQKDPHQNGTEKN